MDGWIRELLNTIAGSNPFIQQSTNPAIRFHNFAANFSIA